MKLKKNLGLWQLPVFQNAYYWFILPLAIVFIALICGLIYNSSGNRFSGFANVGIDFAGGTVLTVEVNGVGFIDGGNYDKKPRHYRRNRRKTRRQGKFLTDRRFQLYNRAL